MSIESQPVHQPLTVNIPHRGTKIIHSHNNGPQDTIQEQIPIRNQQKRNSTRSKENLYSAIRKLCKTTLEENKKIRRQSNKKVTLPFPIN